MFKKRNVADYSVEELEKMLRVKQRESRMERFQQMANQGHSPNQALLATSDSVTAPTTLVKPQPAQPDTPSQPPKTRRRKVMDAALLSLEVIALAGLVGVLIASYFNLKELNTEVSLAQQTVVEQQTNIAHIPTASEPTVVALLPGGHTPPTAPGGAIPDVPAHLQQWVQTNNNTPNLLAPGAIEVEPAAAAFPTRIVIPKININAPIVGGVSWDDLKKGVGHLPGSAVPGQRGNMYLAAHNDIYGEIFRYLEKLEIGDEYFIYAGEEEFRYRVAETRIIDPTEVDVMLPTTEPIATLQTCYPYMVDTHRFVVISKLAE